MVARGIIIIIGTVSEEVIGLDHPFSLFNHHFAW